MKYATVSVIALLLLAACTLTGNVVKGDTIKIGWIGPLTGDAATIGQSARVATELAVEEVNAAGGINGKRIEVLYEDGKCNGKDASTAASKLINVDDVQFIVGGHCSPETLALAPISDPANTISISPCSSAPAVTSAGDYVFRVYPSDTFQGAYAAEYLYGRGYRRVALLPCISDFCEALIPIFTERFESLGGRVVAVEKFESDARDLRLQLTKIKAANPDAIYFMSYTEAGIVGIRQLRQMGIDTPVLGTDGWDDPKIPAEAGAAADGVEYVVPSSPSSEAFQKKMLTRTDAVTICAPQAYDIVHIYANLANAGADTPEKLKAALYAMAPYEGVSGIIAFDGNGDIVSADYVVKHYENGRIVEVNA